MRRPTKLQFAMLLMVTMSLSVQAAECGADPTYDAVILKDLSEPMKVEYSSYD